MRILTTLFCLLFPLAAGAGACGDITVAFYDHGALYSRQADGQWAGIDKDVVEELGRRTGCRFHPVLESRVRIWAMLANGTLDMSVSGIPLPERQKLVRFVPYLHTRNFVLLHHDVPAANSSLEGFLADPALKVGVVKSFRHGPTYDTWLAKLRTQGRVYETADFSTLLRMLKNGRVQAIMAVETSWVAAVRQQGMGGQVRAMNWAPHDVVVAALMLSRARLPAETAALFERHVRAMREDGSLKAIYERHVGVELAPALLP